MRHWIAAAFAVTMLAGCSPSVISNVEVFQTDAVLSAKTFTVVPRGPLAGTLEAATYADLVADKLVAQGWKRSAKGEVEVALAFAIDNGTTISSTVPVFGQTGGGSSSTFGTVSGTGGFATFSGTTYSSPTYGVVGTSQVAETIFSRALVVDMYQVKDGTKIFESTVTSQGASGTFSVVAKCMIDALFQDFPGKAGARHATVQIEGEKCMLQ